MTQPWHLPNLAFSVKFQLNPINIYYWYDQLNGLVLGVNLIAILVILNAPYPLSSILGDDFCNWCDFPGVIYLSGRYFHLRS